MAFTEDLAPLFVDFGDDAMLASAGVRVIFDGPGGTFAGMSVDAPQVQIATANVPDDYDQASLVITTGRGVGTYKVREHQPDGTGMSLLLLTKVAP